LHGTQVTIWVKATLPALGGVGVLLSAFLDSSFVPLPLVTDLIVVDLSSRNPLRMPYYAAMAAIGSVAGCIWIYALARKGGQVYYRNKQQQPSGRIRMWVQKYPFTSVLLPAVTPFPVPFKPFVIAQGVFRVPFIPFVVGTFVGRGALFFMEGFLGARYGAAAREFAVHQKFASVAMLVALVAIFAAIRWFPIHRRNQQSPII
jgi:membrane protein YqaA with SNARE-associated domain